jgi:hypothetical protein
VGKKNDQNDLGKVVDDLIKDVGEDRDRLVEFLESLISNYGGEQSVGIAEYVAKLADALTRQNQIRVATIKALAKATPKDDSEEEMEEIHKEIGLPFEDEVDEGTN